MKLGAWLIMLTALMIFLSFLGIETGASGILSSVGINGLKGNAEDITTDIESSSFWNTIFGTTGILVLLGVTGAVIVGLFGKGYDVSLVLATFIIFVGGLFIQTFYLVVNHAITTYGGMDWIIYLTVFIFGSLTIGFIMACVDYFGGR